MEEYTKALYDRMYIPTTKETRRRSSIDSSSFVKTFKVRSMKIEGVAVDSPDIETANDAVDDALNCVGSLMKKQKHDTVLKLSWKDGVEVLSKKTKMTLFSYKIHEVVYCNVDKRYPEIFVFMGTKMKTETRCRTFLCDDEAKARAICLIVAKCYEMAFNNWQSTKKNTDLEKFTDGGGRRRTLTTGDVTEISPLPVEKLSDLKPSSGRRRTLPTLGDLTTFSEEGTTVQTLDSVTEIPTNVNLGRRRTMPTLQVPDLPSRPRSRSGRRGSAEPGDFYGACDYDMDRTFEELMNKRSHHGKYALLGRPGSNWEVIEENIEVREKMRGEDAMSDSEE